MVVLHCQVLFLFYRCLTCRVYFSTMVCFVMHCEDATIQDSTFVDLALEYEYQETSVYIADLVLRVLRLKILQSKHGWVSCIIAFLICIWIEMVFGSATSPSCYTACFRKASIWFFISLSCCKKDWGRGILVCRPTVEASWTNRKSS